MPSAPLILVLNAGSSSLKLAAFSGDHLVLRAGVERTNQTPDQRRLWIVDPEGQAIEHGPVPTIDSSSLLQAVIDTLVTLCPGQRISAVGHRVVHGGDRFTAPVRVTPDVLVELESLTPLAPLHQPHNVGEIRTALRILPDVPQVACFDTAFHATMPWKVRMLGLPRKYYQQGVKRYGFHGISYESIASRLPAIDPRAAVGRTVVCHLGSGASLCALRGGKSIATTMSFTPLDGLLMSTRAGAIDAGVILHLLRHEQLSPDQIEHLLDRESGLLGVSGISSDLRDLLASPAPEAAEAVDLFCYRVVRDIGAMTSALGGLDAIVFTAGIGENSPDVRERVCSQLAWLGIEFDSAANLAGSTTLHSPLSRVSVLRIPTDEEAVIAQQTTLALVD